MRPEEAYWRHVQEVVDQDDDHTEEELIEDQALWGQPTITQIARSIADDLDTLNRQMKGKAA